MATKRSSPITNPALKSGDKPGATQSDQPAARGGPHATVATKPVGTASATTSLLMATGAKPEPVEAISARLAKATLMRLAHEKLEPTPDNYARAYRQEAGELAPSAIPERAHHLLERLASRLWGGSNEGVVAELSKAAQEGRWDAADRLANTSDAFAGAWATLIDRVVRAIDRGGKQWTTARKKDSLQRVLSGSRSDASKLQQRLNQLIVSWDTDKIEAAQAHEAVGSEALIEGVEVAGVAGLVEVPDACPTHSLDPSAPAPALMAASLALFEQPDSDADNPCDVTPAWNQSMRALCETAEAALPTSEAANQRLANALQLATLRVQEDGMSAPLADEVTALCSQANRIVRHRHHLVSQLGQLCHELASSLTDMTENDSWVRGQCDVMRNLLSDGFTARGVKSVSELLHHTRQHQGRLRAERDQAREALKGLITQMLSELSELGHQTGRFHESVGRYAGVIEKADSLESLAGAVREMVEESRTVQSLVQQTQERLQTEHSKADVLTHRVTELESELKRLAQEVSTDQLTQIANRRGLHMAFEVERGRFERDGSALSVGLLDIDNFKRLNDELGHSAGDVALKSLAAVVSETLRPTDIVARYGGEEFVVLLPHTPVEEGQQILSRLQRTLSGGLFMHEQKQVFVTFSAGITTYRQDERIEDTLERADQALYEAKRTGKNRTCIG